MADEAAMETAGALVTVVGPPVTVVGVLVTAVGDKVMEAVDIAGVVVVMVGVLVVDEASLLEKICVKWNGRLRISCISRRTFMFLVQLC